MPNKELTQKAAFEWQPDYDLDEYLDAEQDWDVDDKLYDRSGDFRPPNVSFLLAILMILEKSK